MIPRQSKQIVANRILSQSPAPYLGCKILFEDIRRAIEATFPWLDVDLLTRKHDIMCNESESGGVIACFQGRLEAGPRALGHRSILVDPSRKGLMHLSKKA